MAKRPKPPKPGQPPPPVVSRPVRFVWGQVPGATSYTLQVGSVALGADLYNVAQGNVLTAEVNIPIGVRYTRIVACSGTTPISTTRDQMVVVT